MDTCRKSESQVIAKAVARIAPKSGRVNVLGYDQDDYAQILKIKAWLAGQCVPEESDLAHTKWVFRAVKNQLRSCQRQLGRHPEMLRYDLLPDDDRGDPGFERRVSQRVVVKKLFQRLSEMDANMLTAFALADCNISEAWKAQGQPMSYRHYRRQVRRIQKRCRNFIVRNYPKTGLRSESAAL